MFFQYVETSLYITRKKFAAIGTVEGPVAAFCREVDFYGIYNGSAYIIQDDFIIVLIIQYRQVTQSLGG